MYSAVVRGTLTPAAGKHTRTPGAQQKRSLRTESLLLAAAARVLDRDGLDAATVPHIAAEARLSPASIYRRFADKDFFIVSSFMDIF